MNIQVTDLARWQVRLTLQDLLRRRDPEAGDFSRGARALLFDADALPGRLQPLKGLQELPQREVVTGRYHFFFREEGDTLWFPGLWPTLYGEERRF